MEEEKSEDKTMKNSKGTGLIIAIIVIMLIFIYIIIGPHNHRQYSPRLICVTNMSGLGRAMLIYVNDFDGYPTPEKWCDLLIEKTDVTPKSFLCKGAKEGPCNYAINKYLSEIGTAKDPDIVILFETHPGWNQVGGPEILTIENHHGDGCHVVFLDSHVEFIKAEDISKLKWKPD